MEKEKTEEFQEPDFALSDCIEFLRYLQERTRCYGQIFREMGEDYCKKLASTEKALLESAIQYLLSIDKQPRCDPANSPDETSA